eukprot:4853007-Prymnesium_polylepis.1
MRVAARVRAVDAVVTAHDGCNAAARGACASRAQAEARADRGGWAHGVELRCAWGRGACGVAARVWGCGTRVGLRCARGCGVRR